MLSIPLGPMALPVLPLLFYASVWLCTALARRWAGADGGAQAERIVWGAALAGLLAARLGHVLHYWDAFAASPWAMLDIRDGGWFAPLGYAAAGAWMAWRAWPVPTLQRALGQAVAVAGGVYATGLLGIAIYTGTLGGSLGTFAAGASGGTTQKAVPNVALVALASPGTPTSAPTSSLPQIVHGKPAVVNLWATWCGPCRAEMPTLAAAQQANPDVAFVFVNQGESSPAVLAYLQRSGLGLHNVWLDSSGSLGTAINAPGLPTTLFFNAQGQQVDAHFGVLNAAALRVKLGQIRGQ